MDTENDWEPRLIDQFSGALATVKKRYPDGSSASAIVLGAFLHCAVQQCGKSNVHMFSCVYPDDLTGVLPAIPATATGNGRESATPELAQLVISLSHLFNLDENLARGCCQDFTDIVTRVISPPTEGSKPH